MNAMQPLRRHLINIFIGLPGGFIWAWSSLGIIIVLTTIEHQHLQSDLLRSALILAALTALNLTGYSMIVASELVTGSPEFKMPPRRLPLFFCLRLLEQLLAVLGVSAFSHAAFLLGPGNGASCAIAAAFSLLLYLTFEFTNRKKRVRGDQWRKEPTDAPLPTEYS